MMLQYRELKQRYPDYLLLFRLGDFYELFFEDAHAASRLLQLTLTSRQKGEGAIPMAGIPHHAADGYITRLIRAGQKVAVCEQMEAPAKGKKLVGARSCVVTPGTITDTQLRTGPPNTFCSRFIARRAPRRPLVDVPLGLLGGEQDGGPPCRAALLGGPPSSWWRATPTGTADKAKRSAW
jgi:DNA mismatch repair protein MutS